MSNKSSPARSLKGSDDGEFQECSGKGDEILICDWLKIRDQKKWKFRRAALTRLSPAADSINLEIYKNDKDKFKQLKSKCSMSLDRILALETGFNFDKESNTMAILCEDISVILAFESRERLIQWKMKLNNNLTEIQQFPIQISQCPTKSKIIGSAKVHVQNRLFAFTCDDTPPKLLGFWEYKNLRKYGVVNGKFCFEGGSLCGKSEGAFVFLSDRCEEIFGCMKLGSAGKLIAKRNLTKNSSATMDNTSARRLSKMSSLDRNLNSDAFQDVFQNHISTKCVSLQEGHMDDRPPKTSDNSGENRINYDVPPPPVPVKKCGCSAKMKLIVETERCETHKNLDSCPYQQMMSCLPYNLFQMAYCRRGDGHERTHSSKLPLYATVDLSKKSKNQNARSFARKELNYSDVDFEKSSHYVNLNFEKCNEKADFKNEDLSGSDDSGFSSRSSKNVVGMTERKLKTCNSLNTGSETSDISDFIDSISLSLHGSAAK